MIGMTKAFALPAGRRAVGWPCLLLWALMMVAMPAQATTLIGVTSENTGSGSTSPSITLTVPTGTLEGHFMLAQISLRGGSAVTVTPPAGWTLLRRDNNGTALAQVIYYHVAAASEPADYTWSISPAQRVSGGMMTWADVDTSTPVLTHDGQTGASSTSLTAPSITTASADARVIGLFASANGNNATTTTAPTGMSLGYDVGTGAGPNGVTAAMGHAVQVAAGASGAKTATMGTAAVTIGATIALKSLAVVAIDHFLIDIGAGTASTCAARNIQIAARDAGDTTLTSYAGTVNISVSSGHGDWSVVTANGTLTPGGADSGTASYQFVTADNGLITLALTNHHADDLTITVVDSALASTSSTSTSLSFRDNAFVLSPTTSNCLDTGCAGTSGDVVVAARDHGFSVAMWRRDLTTGDCAIATGYAGNKPLKAWITRNGSDPGGTAPTIGALNLPNAAPGADNLSLDFVAGVASFPLGSSDVGKYALSLRDDSRVFATGMDIDGASNTLTVRPFGLGFTSISKGAIGNPGGTAPGDAIFTAAGQTFSATIGGYRWSAADDANTDGVPDSGSTLTDNGLTPAFAWSTALSAVAPYTPAGGVLGTLAGSSPIAPGGYSGGDATVSDLTYSEVGSMTLRADIIGYLNTAGVGLYGSSTPVGRFTPDHFDVGYNIPQFTTACVAGGFTYLGQAFGYTTAPVMTVTARAADGTTTQNYTGSFWKITNGSLTGRSYTAGTGTLDSGGLPDTNTDPSIAELAGQPGVGTLTFAAGSGLAFTRTLPVLPFDAEIRLAIDVIDADGVIHAANPAAFGDTTTGNGIAFSDGKSQRFGRLVLAGAYGSELLNLSVDLTAEYWDDLDGAGPGTDEGFITHTADSCTGVAAAQVSITDASGPLTSADTTLTVAASPFVAGSWHGSASGPYTQLSAPGAGKTGSVDLGIDLVTAGLPWLTDDLDGVDQGGDGLSYDDNPTARAVFGLYQQKNGIIYQREVY